DCVGSGTEISSSTRSGIGRLARLSVIGPTLPSRWFGFLLFLSASGEWRGLTLQGSQRFLKLFAQSLDLGLRVLQLIAKCLNLSGWLFYSGRLAGLAPTHPD